MDLVLDKSKSSSSSSSSEGYFQSDWDSVQSEKRTVHSLRSNNSTLRSKSKKEEIAELNSLLFEREVQIAELQEEIASLSLYAQNAMNEEVSRPSQRSNDKISISGCDKAGCIELNKLYEGSVSRNMQLRKELEKYENGETRENHIQVKIRKGDGKKVRNTTQEALLERQARLELGEPDRLAVRVQELGRELDSIGNSNFKLKLGLFVMSACLIGIAGYAVYGKGAIGKEGMINFFKSIDLVKIQGFMKTNFTSLLKFLNIQFSKVVNQLKHIDHKNYLLLFGRNLAVMIGLILAGKTSIFLIDKLVRLISQMFNIIDDRRFMAAVFMAVIVWTVNQNLVIK